MSLRSLLRLTGLAGLLFLSSCGAKKNIKNNPGAGQVNSEHSSTAKEEQSPADTQISAPTSVQQRIYRYIETYAPIAVEEMLLYGIPASITIAQGILESGSGVGQLAVKANNHFGIKCHRTWTGERVYHDDDELGECFRKYTDVKYSYRDHSLFLTQRSRYSDLFSLKVTDYKGWARGLKKAGYATDPKYPDKLISLIERFELWQFDQEHNRVRRSKNRDSDSSVKDKRSRTGNGHIHIVVKGDTLYSLSKRFGLTVDDIMKYNRLNSTDLSVGQELKIPR